VETVLLSVQEAADVLSLGSSTVRFLIKTGQLESVRIKTRQLVLRSSVYDLVLRLSKNEGEQRDDGFR
jgi:excisionase family DNA binding protein